jgi:putative transposase
MGVPSKLQTNRAHELRADIMTEAVGIPDLTEISKDNWERARRRFEVIQSFAKLTDRTRTHGRLAANELGCSIALIYRLLGRYQADPRLTSCLPEKRGRRLGLLQLPANVEQIIETTVEELHLTRQRPRMSHVVTEIIRRCRVVAIPPPSRSAIELRVRRRPAAEVTARRQGRKAARHLFGAAVGHLNAPWPLSIVQIDHTKVDVIVVDSVTRAPIQRPWLTLAIDVHSRCIFGFHSSLDAPSATSVALCLSQGALPKAGWLSARNLHGEWPVQGIPERLHLDNGKDFHSEALRRGCEQYGIAIDYRPVRTPHYGGHIERLIGTMMGKVHMLPGTTFSSVEERGDIDPQKSAAMTLEEVEQWLATTIVGIYHQEIHRGLHTTPLDAWTRSVNQTQQIGRVEVSSVSDPHRFFIDFLPIQRRRVRREGVFLHDIAYWSDVLTTYIGEREKLVVRFDPRDLSRIYLQTPDGQYFQVPYRDLGRRPISLWEHRLALKHLRQDGRRAVNEDTIFEAIDQIHRITESAMRDTKTVRRQRERRRQWSKAVGMEPNSPRTTDPTIRQESLPASERLFADFEEWG